MSSFSCIYRLPTAQTNKIAVKWVKYIYITIFTLTAGGYFRGWIDGICSPQILAMITKFLSIIGGKLVPPNIGADIKRTDTLHLWGFASG